VAPGGLRRIELIVSAAALKSGATQRQLLRFGAIGVASNAALYGVYLLLTWLGVGPKLAMTLVYGAGVLGTFLFNRRWTFDHAGAVHSALARYAATYGLVYLFNLGAMLALVDGMGLPHRWVMLALIPVCAGITFLLQKFWVFPAQRHTAPG
jgi:putative flippase GtrA